MLLVELGGGSPARARGSGWVNVDILETADIVFDLDQDTPFPFDDDSVDEVYSSHCFEHLKQPHRAFQEVARILKPHGRAEIRVPHWLSPMAMCLGHVSVISKQQIDNMCIHFLEDHWKDCRKRLSLVSWDQIRGELFDEAKRAFPLLSDHQLMLFIPGACHECRFYFEAIPNEIGAR